MDLAFFRRAQDEFDSRTPAPLEYPVLLATLGTAQGATPTVRSVHDRHKVARFAAAARPPIVEILLASSAWRDAVPFQGGSFNRQLAGALARPCKPK